MNFTKSELNLLYLAISDYETWVKKVKFNSDMSETITKIENLVKKVQLELSAKND